MTKKIQTQGGKNKKKGSAFERDVSAKLSVWIYGDKSVLRRSPSSGAEHQYGQGADVSLFQPNYDPFKYFVEVKCGYECDIFNARKQILNWYNIAKTKNKLNYTIWIIWKILNRGIILCSDKKLNNVDELFIIDNLYVYDFKILLNTKYDEIK